MKKLSIIISFRCENSEHIYLIDRINDVLDNILSQKNNNIEVIIVDSGSVQPVKELCEKLADNNNDIYYHYFDKSSEPFSIGECRNIGATLAQGDLITFMDIDLRMPKGFLFQLFHLIDKLQIEKIKKSVISIPFIYLKQEATNLYQKNIIDADDIYIDYLLGRNNYVEMLALCSSMIIVNRLYFLETGGYDDIFRSHGCEDFEYMNRLLNQEQSIPMPTNYSVDKRSWNTYTYDGFRSRFSITGQLPLQFKLFVIHLWHPRPSDASFYKKNAMQNNRKILTEKLNDKNPKHPEIPLLNNIDKKVLFIGERGTLNYNLMRIIFTYTGYPICKHENDFFLNEVFDENLFKETISKEKIDSILFPNPYGNEKRLCLYNFAKKNGLKFYVFDRGALPDSWFFDSKGFNADSTSYKIQRDSVTLSEDKVQKINFYIEKTLNSNDHLEKQGAQIGLQAIKHKLGIKNKKILFVPLQRPSDSVIKYFSGAIGSYENFIKVIDTLGKILYKKGWVVVCKKHPLETVKPFMNNIIWASDDDNIVDLIKSCDRVALINSGVGVYSIMCRKPCFVFGSSFYSNEDLNYSVTELDLKNLDSLAQKIIEGFKVDNDVALQFINHLLHFYSFGKAHTIQKQESDGSFRNLTTQIDFYKLNLNNVTKFEYEHLCRDKIATSAPIFSRYGLDLFNKRMEAKKKRVEKPVSTSSIQKEKLLNLNKTSTANKEKQEIKTIKYMKKFIRNPKKYCQDSKISTLKLIGKIL